MNKGNFIGFAVIERGKELEGNKMLGVELILHIRSCWPTLQNLCPVRNLIICGNKEFKLSFRQVVKVGFKSGKELTNWFWGWTYL